MRHVEGEAPKPKDYGWNPLPTTWEERLRWLGFGEYYVPGDPEGSEAVGQHIFLSVIADIAPDVLHSLAEVHNDVQANGLSEMQEFVAIERWRSRWNLTEVRDRPTDRVWLYAAAIRTLRGWADFGMKIERGDDLRFFPDPAVMEGFYQSSSPEPAGIDPWSLGSPEVDYPEWLIRHPELPAWAPMRTPWARYREFVLRRVQAAVRMEGDPTCNGYLYGEAQFLEDVKQTLEDYRRRAAEVAKMFGCVRTPQKKRNPFEHFKWLAEFQILGCSYSELADRYCTSTRNLEKIIPQTAEFIRLKLRTK